MREDRLMDKFEDRIFGPYWYDKIMKEFTNHTGYQVSENQEIKLKKFLYTWSLDCIKDAING